MTQKTVISGMLLLTGALLWLAASRESGHQGRVSPFASDGDETVSPVFPELVLDGLPSSLSCVHFITAATDSY